MGFTSETRMWRGLHAPGPPLSVSSLRRALLVRFVGKHTRDLLARSAQFAELPQNRRHGIVVDVGPGWLVRAADRAQRQRQLGAVDGIVLSLSAKGLTTGEISAHLAEVYGASVSKDTISTGLCAGAHGDGEGPKDWLRILAEIKNRGVGDELTATAR